MNRTSVDMLAREVGRDALGLVGLLTAIGNLALLRSLFSGNVSSRTVYAASLTLFVVMVTLARRNAQKRTEWLPRSAQRSLYTTLSFIYAAMAVVALLPAGYRWVYVSTDWLPVSGRSREPEIGQFIKVFESRLAAAALESPLQVSITLDPVRTSFECVKPRDPKALASEIHTVEECAAFAIPGGRLDRLRHGHGFAADKTDALIRTDEGSSISGAFDGLMAVASYRQTKDALLERGPSLLAAFSRNPAGKARLLASGLLPNVMEWERLTREKPLAANALRRFIVEWVGFVDPFFRVAFRNSSGAPVQVSSVQYRATPRRAASPAVLIGAFQPPRYLLELEEVLHNSDVIPAIDVPAVGVAAMDLQVRLKQPDPGVTYDIRLALIAGQPALRVDVPSFSITFSRAGP